MGTAAEKINCLRQLQKFVEDLQKNGTDTTDGEVIQWIRKNPEFCQHADKLYALMHDGKAPVDSDWIENSQNDIPTSRRWREEQQKQKKKRKVIGDRHL